MQFTRVAQIDRKGLDEIFFWYPVPPPGYASLGCIVTKTDEMPSKDSICCPKLSLVSQANMAEDPITRSSSSKGPYCWSIWKIENQVILLCLPHFFADIISPDSMTPLLGYRDVLSWQGLM